MGTSNGHGNKEHITKLNILLQTKAPAEDLMQAMAHCFIDVLEKIEDREERQREIDIKLFGSDKLKIKGFFSEVQPIINDYRKFKWLAALLWIPGAAIIIAFWEYVQRKFFI